jgi:hypothetical protein
MTSRSRQNEVQVPAALLPAGLPGGLVLGSFDELAVDSDRSWDI